VTQAPHEHPQPSLGHEVGSGPRRWDPHPQWRAQRQGCGDLWSLSRRCHCHCLGRHGARCLHCPGRWPPWEGKGPLRQPAPRAPLSPAGWPVWTPTCGSPGGPCTASPWSAPSPPTGSASTPSRAAPRTSWWSPSPNPVSVPKPTRCGGPGWVSMLHGRDPLPGGTWHIQGRRDRAVRDFPSPPRNPVGVWGLLVLRPPVSPWAPPWWVAFPRHHLGQRDRGHDPARR